MRSVLRTLVAAVVMAGCAQDRVPVDPTGTWDLVITETGSGTCMPAQPGRMIPVTMQVLSGGRAGGYVIARGVYSSSLGGTVTCTDSQCDLEIVEDGPTDAAGGIAASQIFTSLRLDTVDRVSGTVRIRYTFTGQGTCDQTFVAVGAVR